MPNAHLDMLTWRSAERLGINFAAEVVRAGRPPE